MLLNLLMTIGNNFLKNGKCLRQELLPGKMEIFTIEKAVNEVLSKIFISYMHTSY